MSKKVLWLATILVIVSLAVAEAQQAGTIPRIGYLSPTGELNTSGPQVERFRQGLRDPV